jgi:hypothetical protein
MNNQKPNYGQIWLSADFVKPKNNKETILLGTAKNANAIGPGNKDDAVQIKNDCPEGNCIIVSNNSKTCEWKKINDIFKNLDNKNNYFYHFFQQKHEVFKCKKYIKTCSFPIKNIKPGKYRILINYTYNVSIGCRISIDRKYLLFENKESSCHIVREFQTTYFSVFEIKENSNEIIVEILGLINGYIRDISLEIEEVNSNVNCKQLSLISGGDLNYFPYNRGNAYTYTINDKYKSNSLSKINSHINTCLNFISVLDNILYIEFVSPLSKKEKTKLDEIINLS